SRCPAGSPPTPGHRGARSGSGTGADGDRNEVLVIACGLAERVVALRGHPSGRAGSLVLATQRRCGAMDQRPPLSPETLAAQALGDVAPLSGGLVPVINPSTTYEQLADGSHRQDRAYTRADNPTYEVAERLLAALEGAGCACVLFASGMAAVTAVFQSLLPG